MTNKTLHLSKDDLYEVEKCLDIMGGWISDKLCQVCATATSIDAIHFKAGNKNPLDNTVEALVESQDKLKSIRDKLKDVRLGVDKK